MPADLRGQRVVILGLARQGVALARYLAGQGAQVVVSDRQPAEKLAPQLAALHDLPIEFVLGGHPESLLDGASLLCLSGGVSAALPLARLARGRGVPLSNDSQIFLEAAPAGVLVAGITGSAGKTTTTTLVGRMCVASDLTPPAPLPSKEGVLRRNAGAAALLNEPSKEGVLRSKDENTRGVRGPAGGATQPPGRGARQVFIGGNIGRPLVGDLDRMHKSDLVVMELSSFQLEIMTRSPQVAAVLNITPNHLDRHGSMEAYAEAKSHILRFQGPDDVAVLGRDDPGAMNLAPLVQGHVHSFSALGPVPDGAYLDDDRLMLAQGGQAEAVATVADIGLRGRHNVLNVLAALAISSAAGATPTAMRAGLVGFTGVEHRLELVRELRGVRWYNDSIATAPERVIAALRSFDEPIVLLLGGRDKNLPWDELARLVRDRVKATLLFGEAGPLIEAALIAAGVPADRCRRFASLAPAVPAAASLAAPGDVVLLAPGCTGYDEFLDFAERGEKFKQWVRDL